MSKSINPNKRTVLHSSKPSLFARQLLREWRRLELPRAGGTVLVAVSGGADSIALLGSLDELTKAKKLELDVVVAHLNHRLRGKASDADARWVRNFSKQLGRRALLHSVSIKRRARQSNDNLEQAARRARYEFLKKTAQENKAVAILTAHTLDDQAETVLLNLLRGSGTDGLGGIEPVRNLDPKDKILIARPLLGWAKHADTQNYCRQRGIDFRVDEMNEDESFARVRVRKQLLPLMRTFNPQAAEAISRSAEILREDSSALEAAAARLIDYSAMSTAPTNAGAIHADLLRMVQPALRRRALRMWLMANRGDLRRLEKAHIAAIEKLLFSNKSGRLIELPGGGSVTRRNGCLHYSQKNRG